jgi:hypothetical protein
MNERSTRRLWWLGLWLMLPWPLALIGDAFVPASRYVMLGFVSAAVALLEGGSGPVAGIVALLLAMAVATTLACWLLAFGVARGLARLSNAQRRAITLGSLCVALLVCLVFEPYRTPFGRSLTGGLLDVLS